MKTTSIVAHFEIRGFPFIDQSFFSPIRPEPVVEVVEEVSAAPAETEESARPQSLGEDVTEAEQGGKWMASSI